MILSISEAARMAKRDRKTIQRAVAAGILSMSHSAAGGRGIEVAELERVYGPLSHPSPAPVAATMSQPVAPDVAAELAALRAENAALKAVIQAQEKNIEDLRTSVRLLEYRPTPDRPKKSIWKPW